MPYLTDYDNAYGDPALLKRIQVGLVDSALDVQAESTGTANHSARSAFSLKILSDPTGYASLMAVGICEEGAITAASTDAQIKTRVSAVYNAYCVQS